MPKKFIEKAAIQALSESLGYDEGRAYYLMIKNDESELKKEFSHSKKYRVFKVLFDRGAAAKYKPQKQDYFSYILLPPSFLYLEKVEKEIVTYLEKLYFDNYPSIFESNFSQLIMRNEKGLLIFLLNYYMKEKASVIADVDLKKFLGDKSSMITLTKINEERKFGVIDGTIAFEFSKVYNGKTEDSVGFIARDAENPGKNNVTRIEKKLELLVKNPKEKR